MDLTGAEKYIASVVNADDKLALAFVELLTGSNWRPAVHVLRDIIQNPRSRFSIDLSNILTAHLRQRHARQGHEPQ